MNNQTRQFRALRNVKRIMLLALAPALFPATLLLFPATSNVEAAGGVGGGSLIPTIGFCITDGRTGDNITFTNGGAYTFTQCSTGFTLMGTGVVSNHSGTMSLTDRKADRSVNAGLLMGQKTGRLVIYYIGKPGGAAKTYTADQTSPNQVCGCGHPVCQ